MRSKLGWVALFLLAAAGVWWWRAGGGGVDPAAPPGPTAEPAADESPSDGASRTDVAAPTPAAERASVAAPAQPASESVAPTATAEATVHVTVFARESQAPLAGIRVSVAPTRLTEAGWSSSWVEGSRGGEHESPLSDAEGRVEFRLPPGVEYRVSADGSHSLGESRRLAGAAQQVLPALAAGESRELRLEVPTATDLIFYGRVVAAEDGSPLAGARIRMHEALPGEPPVRVSDADGRFEARSASWLDDRGFTVKLSGRAQRSAVVCQGHEAPERALTIRLARNATLRLRARGAAGAAVEGLEVGATASRFELQEEQGADTWSFGGMNDSDPSWGTTLESDGSGVLEELPPNASLALTVQRDGRIVLRPSEPIRLEPGETRELELVVGSGATLAGSVRDQDGEHVAGAKLWLQAVEYGGASYFRAYDDPELETTAGADGRYTFVGVAAGKWRLGPAAEREGRDEPRPELLAPATRIVEIAADAPSVELDLVVYRGLYITGRVVDERGAPAPGAGVELSQGLSVHSFETADGEGNFAIGPLAAGEFELRAGGFGDSRNARGEPVSASAGAQGVILGVRAGATIVGRVVDASTGALHSAALSYRLLLDDGDFHGATLTSTEGEFELGGLDPGPYSLVATRGEDIAATEVLAVAGASTEPLTLRLGPAATLELTWTGPEQGVEYAVRVDGVEVGSGWVDRRAPETVKIVPGEAQIEFRPSEWDEELQRPRFGTRGRASARLEPGERRALALAPAR